MSLEFCVLKIFLFMSFSDSVLMTSTHPQQFRLLSKEGVFDLVTDTLGIHGTIVG